MFKCDEQITFWSQVKPDVLAFVDESHEVTYAQLDSFTRKIATSLHKRGLKQDEVVAIILPNYLGWLFTLSLYRLGISTVSQNNLNPFTEQLMPDWVITIDAHPGFSAEKSVMITDEYLEELNGYPEMQNLPGFKSEESIASFFSTSGTTGEIKYVAATALELRNIATRPGTNDSFGEDGVLSRFMFGAAWAHWHALKCLVLGKTYYSCVFNDYRLAKFVMTYPIRTLIGSPAQIANFLDVQKSTGTKLPLLKTIIMGGSVPSQALIDRIRNQVDCKLYNTYGSTEAGHIAIYPVTDEESQTFSVRPPVQLQIVDENDQPLSANEIGIIRYKNFEMSHSYYNNKEATAEFFRDGFFYPGDMGLIDGNGGVVLHGRSSETINLGGAKLNPEIIDRIALAQLGVVDAAAFPLLGSKGVEQLAVALVTGDGFSRETFEATMLAKSPYPLVAVVQMDAIPRNENGKVLRSILSERHRDVAQ